MRHLRTLLLVVIPLVCLAAIPINPLAGTWAGEGKGNAHPPGTTIYPWQYWKGEVSKDGKAFYGEWKDEKGNHGKFKGEIDWVSHTTAYAKGIWTWDHPSSVSKKAGDFKMKFSIWTKECKGEWTSIYPSSSAQGIMWGKKVD